VTVTPKTRDPEKQVWHAGDHPFDERLTTFFFCYEGRFSGNDGSREDSEHARGGLSNTSVIKPTHQDVHMTGEEAYQRRLAMSSGFQPASLTTSSAPVPDRLEAMGGAVVELPVPLTKIETEEEVHLGRLAMSQADPPPSPPKGSLPQQLLTEDENSYQQPTLPPSQPTSRPPSHIQQGSSEHLDLPERNLFASQLTQPPPPSVPSPPGNLTGDFEERVRNSRNAAAAIAARFSAFAPPAEGGDSSEPVPEGSEHEPPKRCVLFAICQPPSP